ncbi:MAG: hypothetical protein RSH52_21700, partial [Janthinobacterium sp.]
MRLLSIKYRLLILLTLILGAGFMATSLASYLASRQAIEHGIADQTLPLTGDNIYSEIQKDMLRPVFISSLMAHDTFVRDWEATTASYDAVTEMLELDLPDDAIDTFVGETRN